MPGFALSPVDSDLCSRLGQIVIKWTAIETLVSYAVGTFMFADLAAMSVVSNSVSVSAQMKWIRALLSSHEHEQEHNQRVYDLISRAEDLRQERNELVHGTWNSEGCDPGTCLVETVNLDRSEIIRARLVTLHDLDDLSRDIDTWIDDYVALGRELGFPRHRGGTKSIFADD